MVFLAGFVLRCHNRRRVEQGERKRRKDEFVQCELFAIQAAFAHGADEAEALDGEREGSAIDYVDVTGVRLG